MCKPAPKVSTEILFKNYKSLLNSNLKENVILGDIFICKDELKINAEKYEKDRFFAANASNKNQNLKLEATSNLATPIIQLLVSISLSIVAYFALGSQLGIELSAEDFVAFITAGRYQ